MVETSRFDPAEYLSDPRDQADLLNDALASGDDAYINHAVTVIARARGLTAATVSTLSLSHAFEQQEPLMRAAA